MRIKSWKAFGLCAVILSAGGLIAAQTHYRAARTSASAEMGQKIIRYLRERFNIPASSKLTVAPLEASPFADFYQTVVTVDNGKQKSAQKLLVTKDGRFLVLGNVYSLDTKPSIQVERTISTANQPSVGPPSAPVTIVEYADLECPTCAMLQKVIETDILPKYGNKVRIVFKDFPLVQIHEWALTAAIASQCTYEIDPPAFFKYRSTVFANQTVINPANVRSLLLDFGERVGIDRLKLATCIDSRASLSRVEADLREGQALSISQTPSCFINGKLVVGANPQDYYNAIDAALRARR